MISHAQASTWFNKNRDSLLRDWTTYLSFPSVSTLPQYHQDCLNCADWLVTQLQQLGFSVELIPTHGNPVILATKQGVSAAPAVLMYAHYDVQPPDPLDGWTTGAFTPTIRDGRMYARGADDNKGQWMGILSALHFLVSQKIPIPTLTLVIEGEEECGSVQLQKNLDNWADRLKGDILMVSDTNMLDAKTPAIVMGLRGVISLSVELSGPLHDLHSGMFGGAAHNPAMVLSRMVASLHRPDGSVAIPGFYDDVRTPTVQEVTLSRKSGLSAEEFQKQTGVPPTAGEVAVPHTDRLSFRPCIDVNGIHSGFAGPGTKTIIPAKATLNLSCRIVPNQDPTRTLASIISHLESYVPSGLTLKTTHALATGNSLRLSIDSAYAAKAKALLDEISGVETAFLWEGASIPVLSGLARVSGAEPLLVGFGLNEDQIHAPNESYSITQLSMGFEYAARMLALLAEDQRPA